jgi:ribonuclease BN (tRNA processing enzyme)
VKLTVVGPAAAYTSISGRASSCYLVEHGGTAIVLDFGQGSFSELWRYRSPATVAAVFISHMHADHNVDLIPLRHWVRFENRGYGPALFGPAELRRRFGDFQADPEFLSDLTGQSLEPREFAAGDLRVEARRVTHIPDSFAFRVGPADAAADASEPGLVYSGDCGVPTDLLPLVRIGDTLLCEAAFGTLREAPGIHLTASEAGSVAARGQAARLLLTHLLDRNDASEALRAARREFDGSVELAEPGMAVDIG